MRESTSEKQGLEDITRRHFLELLLKFLVLLALNPLVAGCGTNTSQKEGGKDKELQHDKETTPPAKKEKNQKKELYSKVEHRISLLKNSLKALEKKLNARFDWTLQFPKEEDLFFPIFRYRWYQQHPNYLTTDVNDPNSFYRWINGEFSKDERAKEVVITITPEFYQKGEKFIKTITDFARNLLTTVLKYPGRVTEIEFGYTNGLASTQTTKVSLEFPYLVDEVDKAKRMMLPYWLHEFMHAGQPRMITKEKEGKFNFTTTGGSLPLLISYWEDWVKVIADELGFFERRFFNHPKDQIKKLLQGGRVREAIDEIAAMLCTDYLLPEEYFTNPNQNYPDRLLPSEWPQRVKEVVDKTLKVIIDGPQTDWGQRLDEKEIHQIRQNIQSLLRS